MSSNFPNVWGANVKLKYKRLKPTPRRFRNGNLKKLRYQYRWRYVGKMSNMEFHLR